MKGNVNIISALNRLLANELSAIDQYFIHAELYLDMGLNKLHEHSTHESAHEKLHATELIQRILFLEGQPDLETRDTLLVGSTVEEMLHNDLTVEYKVADMLRETMALCEREQDFGTRRMLGVLLEDTEMDHAYFLERQLSLIKLIGVENYMQSQMAAQA
ncbi:bacterioferritin [Allohahella marinimesophila]|uniref:Bacterioferritin n=1 Tax=Allohahella marinimesophila TaxID=1054972 RepID=A0ABP7P2X0_9GAMM